MNSEKLNFFKIKGENYIITTTKKEVCCDDCPAKDMDCAYMLDKFLGMNRKPCNNSFEGVQYQFIKVMEKATEIKCLSDLHGKVSSCGNFFIESKTLPLTVRFNNSLGAKRVVLTISREEKSNTLKDLMVFGFDRYTWAKNTILITTKDKLKCYDKETQYDIQRYNGREYMRIWIEKGLFDTIVLSKQEFIVQKSGKIGVLLDS